ncbi:OapA family protein [Serratia sp. DD3]|uniref:OapA family protein n=1 Tax=Serratia sp. DD3 TaxID=1410619 RepID=UPI0004D8106A|nr:LysM-like peptidoglycan-binding domain-containing protein [Serratia sp. DD3]KEY59732.1 opacity-associated protein A LysM-like domain protein [Serratia sp. DD3]
MGRIAPRKRKTPWVYQTLSRLWLNLNQRFKPRLTPTEQETIQTPSFKNRLKALLLRIWHLPDSFQWMEPLPNFHRRWVIIFGTTLLLSLLWPYSDDSAPRPFPVTNQENSALMQAQLLNNGAQQPQQQQPTTTGSPNWQGYEIKAGQTLAQLFRDNGLPVNDVFAMAQVEGRDKPLSNLKAGQKVRIERNANGVITTLAITTADNSEALFRRQTDGSYLRLR